MRYCFADLNPAILNRYPAAVARALRLADNSASFAFIYYEHVGDFDRSAFPDGSEFVFSGAPTANTIRSLIRSIGPDIVIFTAQRVPDSAFASVARELGIPTIMFQHGLYIEFMRRDPLFLVRKLLKVIRYARYAAAIAEVHGAPRRQYVRELGSVFIRGKPYAEARIQHDRLNVDRVLLNGAYWREWHSRKFGYTADAQVVTGYPDFDQLARIAAQPRSDALCYVAQTLVEDGRIARGRMLEFLEMLGSALGDRSLVVKLHPRSDRTLYQELGKHQNVSFTNDILPHAAGYIGHYSTYLVLVPYLTRNLFLWELDGHPTPDVLARIAYMVSNWEPDLVSFIREAAAVPDQGPADWIEHYFWHNPEGAYRTAAREIMSLAGRRETIVYSAAG